MSAQKTISPVVTTAGGDVIGYRNRLGVLEFRGIPYAAAPVGELRFRAPQPHPGWDGARDATQSGPTSPQHAAPFRGPKFNYRALFSPGWIPGDEFLNLNVWTPDASAQLPVMVFIHGGAFNHGNGAVPMYDGSRFARDGVVLVTINYRLGFEGFLPVPGGDVNNGLRDQIAALEWVGANIAAFGGDPSNVTIFGESAGGASVAALLTAPGATPFFSKAICQSGLGPQGAPLDAGQRISAELADLLGVENSRDGLAGVDPGRLLDAADEVSARRATSSLSSEGSLMARPYADGQVLPLEGGSEFASGSARNKKLIAGFNSDEANLFTIPSGYEDSITEDKLVATVAVWGEGAKRLLADLRESRPGLTPGALLTAVQGYDMFGIPTITTIDEHASSGGTSWLYEFAYQSPQWDGRIGAAHLVELPFVFDILDNPHAPALVGEGAPQALADTMHGAWVAFAKTGDPGWAPYTPSTRTTMVFDVESVTTDGFHDELRAIWNG